jgi:hypothetical protein
MIDEATLDKWFSYHPPVRDQAYRYKQVNDASKMFARVIFNMCPPGEDRDVALRTLRRLRMDANLAIACEDDPKP